MDLEAAEQLIRHSHRARYHTPNETPDPGGDPLPDDYANSVSTDGNEPSISGYSLREQKQTSPQPSSRDHNLDGQYGPLTIPPALGQICR